MNDIVERLRDDQPGERQAKREARMELGGILTEAADEIEKLRVERDALRAALVKAIDCVQFWAAYASEYFQDKHDLADDLRDLRAALGEKE